MSIPKCQVLVSIFVLSLVQPVLASELVSFKLTVEDDGMYQVAGADLETSGSVSVLPVSASKLNLFNQGKSVPIKLENLAPGGQFTAKSAIKFLGNAPQGTATRKYRYSRENAYILRLDGSAPPHRFATTAPLNRPSRLSNVATSFRRVNVIDQDEILEQFPTSNYETDHSVYAKIMAPPNFTRVNLDIATLAPDLVSGQSEITLRMLLLGGSATAKNLDHDWTISFGEHVPLGHARWDGFEPFTLENELPAKHFADSSGNTLLSFANAHADKSIDVIYLDWIEMQYEAELAAHDGQVFYSFSEGDSRCDSVRFKPSFASESINVYDLQRETELDVEGALDPDTGKYYVEYVYPLNGEGGSFVALTEDKYALPSRILAVRESSLKVREDVPEYVVISHGSLLEPLEPLIQHRRNQSLACLLVDVDHIYNEYSDGMTSPQAIRDFVDELLEESGTSNTKLRYVFLVGDATYDYRQIIGQKVNLVPTFYREYSEYADNRMPSVAYDDYFVLGSDGGETGVPQVAVGRLPISDADELKGFVGKLIAFEESAATGEKAEQIEAWRKHLLMIASYDSAGMISQFGKKLAGWQTTSILAGEGRTPEFAKLEAARRKASEEKQQLLDHVGRRVVKGIEDVMRKNPELTSDEAAEQWFESQRDPSDSNATRIKALDEEYVRLTDELRNVENHRIQNGIVDAISSGCAVVYFAGHGGAAVWRTGVTDLKSISDMFTYDHVDLLRNGSRCPVVFAATCYSNIFDVPSSSAAIKGGVGIGVSLVKANSGGAIACVGHVARTEVSTITNFATLMCDEIFNPQQPAERLGDAFLSAKVMMEGNASQLISLVGDPATYFGETYRTIQE